MAPENPLKKAIAALEAQRAILGDAVVDAMIAAAYQEASEQDTEAAVAVSSGERKIVTVMFADLSGFTTLVEQQDAETVRNLMNRCFDQMVPVIEKYEGTVDKFIGDEIMALFGAPVAHENDAELALRAALEIQDALNAFSCTAGTRLQVHMGIATGLVIAGGIGSSRHQQYSVLGDAANIASRLVDISEAGQILVDAATFQLATALFEFDPLPPVILKGKQEPQPVYRLLGPRAQPHPLRGLASLGLRAPLVGRAQEMAQLRQAVERLENGQGGMISILGEPGVGKSRLMAELRQQVGTSWYEGRSLSYGETLSYHPFLDLLRTIIEVAPESDQATVEKRLGRFLQELNLATAYPYLADLLGLPLTSASREQLNGLAGESRRWQLFQILEQLLAGLAQKSPLIIVMEDLHWADPSSLALLEHLLPLCGELPILFLLVMRPFYGTSCRQFMDTLEELPALPYRAIPLQPLSIAHSQELVKQLLTIETLPEAVRDLILSRAEGNPFFLEEILRTLIGQGVLQQKGEHWGVSPDIHLEQITIPPTLQGVILARLDRLEHETKAVLQMAAVVGRLFRYRVLDYVSSMEQQLGTLLDEHLARLERVELIRAISQHPELEYIFKHVMVQEVVYETLLREQRQHFHRRVAEALETLFAESMEEHYGLLAYHYQAAGEPEPAVRYLHLAGDRARHRYALKEAESYYRQALTLVADGEAANRQRLMFNLGLVSLARGDFAQAGEHYAAAFQVAGLASARRAYASRPLRICWSETEPHALDPGQATEVDSILVIYQLFAGLVEFDPEMNIVPHLAERWQVDSDGRRYRFYLSKGACWSDGVPLTAHDFVYTWRRHLHPDTASPIAPQMYILRGAAAYHLGETDDPGTIGVRALDDHLLEVALEEPIAYLLPLLTAPIFSPLPQHHWPPGEDLSDMVVSGPFRLAQWRPGECIILERNPRYGGISSGNIARAEIHFLSPEERLSRYRAGQIEMCWPLFQQSQQELEELDLPGRWLRKTMSNLFYCGLNPHPPLDDRRVRQAIGMALDRSALAQRLEIVGSVPARGGFIPPSIPGHTPELSLPYAPQQARELLHHVRQEKELPPLRFDTAARLDSPLIQALCTEWQQVGLEIIPVHVPLLELIQRLHNDPPHLFTMGWTADYPDPHNFIVEAFFQGSSWRESSYWDMARRASRTLNVDERMALYHQLDRRIVVEEALCIPLYYRLESILVHPFVQHYPMLPVTYFMLKDIVVED